MELTYRNATIRYARDQVTLERGGQQEIVPLGSDLIRLLRRRPTRPAVMAALAHDLLGDPSDGPLLLQRDKTYAGCRDRVYRIAVEWNRQIRPLFVPRPTPVAVPKAFGGQGAFTALLDCGLTIYFAKGSTQGRIQLYGPPGVTHQDLPLLPNADFAVKLIGLFLLENSHELADCCAESRRTNCEDLRDGADGHPEGEDGTPRGSVAG